MNNHIMLDIESLSLQPNAQILSISAIKFNPFEITKDFSPNPKLDILLDLDEQANRHQDDSTILWWSKQDPVVQSKIFSEEGRLSINDALDQLNKFCWQVPTIWANGPQFDICVLNNLYAEYNRGIPYKYNAIRDARTAFSLVDIEKPIVTHDSIDDCIRQCKMMQEALKKLGVTKFY